MKLKSNKKKWCAKIDKKSSNESDLLDLCETLQ